MSEASSELSQLRAEALRLRATLQNISTTLESASDDSLQVALRMVKGMALTALSDPGPLRPHSSPGAAPPPGQAPAAKARHPTEPGLPAFDPTPLPDRPTTAGDQKVVIKPEKEPSRKITEPKVDAIADKDL